MKLRSLSYNELTQQKVNRKLAIILAEPELYHTSLPILIEKLTLDYVIPNDVSWIVPLWATKSVAYVRWTRHRKEEYVQIQHNSTEWDIVASSEQGMTALLWSMWIELHNEDEAVRFADAVGFKHCRKALQLWESDIDSFLTWQKVL